MKIGVLFPGQGSQYLGMGQELIEAAAENRELMTMAEEVCGLDLKKLIDGGPMEELTRNSILQPAITITNMICWQSLKRELGDKQVSCFAGHSLGEYSALYAAGVLRADDCMRLVAKRGSLMEREGKANPGGMRAVLGLEIAEVEQVIQDYKGPGVVTAANHNTPQQIVLSGDMEGLDAVAPVVEEKGGKVIALNVSVANHSPLVAKAVPDFMSFMQDIEFDVPKTPVYFNVSGTTETDTAMIKDMMSRQIVSRVHWCDIISTMLSEGVDTFIEVGPKTVLKGMMRKITPKGVKVTSLQCDSPKTITSCLEKLG
ncbi:ACP S-malonyltransferase [Desulfopila sp. IMCC35008]|uniref:ACP S-malonyltransferase n=1 Tax=Desulfopila sp. IMCC35008 TaxID=2653858 RepID=UPI0013D5BEEC|nr:ACP S-malonyltransferase [Desulfopila sp. IMCC35008]